MRPDGASAVPEKELKRGEDGGGAPVSWRTPMSSRRGG